MQIKDGNCSNNKHKINKGRQVSYNPGIQLPACNEDQLMLYLAEVQAINPESIINLATVENLSILCNKVSESLNRMDAYLKTCEPPHQKDLYMQLIKGVNSLYDKLCTEGDFKKSAPYLNLIKSYTAKVILDFQKHYECFHDLRNDFMDCNGPADWTEDADDAKICKAYGSIADCFYVKAAKLCGNEAANLMKELILEVISSVITANCNNVKDNPVVPDAMPDEITNTRVNSQAATLMHFLLPLVVHIFNFLVQ